MITVTKTGQTAKSFAYDARGNLTTDVEDGVNTIGSTYDLGNKLTGIDPTGTANDATFTFDALGRNLTRTVGVSPSTPSVDTYSYVGATETVARIHNVTGGVPVDTDSLVDPAGDRLGVKVSSTINWLVPDLHGSVAASLLANESGFTNALRYDAYGETLATWSGTGGSTPVGEKNWKYQGRLDVSPSGLATPLYDGGARYYAPGIGTFTSLDTVAGSAQNPISMNRFLYAEANPATLIDPTGHCATWIDGICNDHKETASQKATRVAARPLELKRYWQRGPDSGRHRKSTTRVSTIVMPDSCSPACDATGLLGASVLPVFREWFGLPTGGDPKGGGVLARIRTASGIDKITGNNTLLRSLGVEPNFEYPEGIVARRAGSFGHAEMNGLTEPWKAGVTGEPIYMEVDAEVCPLCRKDLPKWSNLMNSPIEVVTPTQEFVVWPQNTIVEPMQSGYGGYGGYGGGGGGGPSVKHE